jgi:hypothetical protein
MKSWSLGLFFPSAVGRVIWNKMRLWLSGSKVKKHQLSIRCFQYPIHGQLGFLELGVQPIKFQGARKSANQISRSWNFSQSGFEGLGVQPIRFWWAGNSAIQVLSISPYHPISFFGTGFVTCHMKDPHCRTVEKLLFSFLLVDLWVSPSRY